MSDMRPVLSSPPAKTDDTNLPTEPCVMLVFGASGDLTKRLLVPALYNLACDGLLSDNFALVGTALEDLSSEAFRERMTYRIKKFHTREFDPVVASTSDKAAST